MVTSGVVVADNHSHSGVSLHSHSSSDHGKVGEDVAMVIIFLLFCTLNV